MLAVTLPFKLNLEIQELTLLNVPTALLKESQIIVVLVFYLFYIGISAHYISLYPHLKILSGAYSVLSNWTKTCIVESS